MIRRLWNLLPAWLRKLMPTIILLVIATVAGATDVFSSQVQDFIQVTMKAKLAELAPFGMNLLIAVIICNIAWLVHGHVKQWAEKAFDRAGATARGKQLGMKVVMLAFWGVLLLIMFSMFAGELMGKFVFGFSVAGAALTFAMQGAANDFICGVLMQFTCRVREGDDMKVIGMEVEGKIRDVGYLSTTVESSDGMLSVPNRKIWESALKVKKTPPSKLILPSGFSRSKGSDDRDCRKGK
jgi:small-conductance mechanosensitive channel